MGFPSTVGYARRGSILVYAVILLALLLSSSLALSILATSGNRTTQALTHSVPAFYAAESCLEQTLRQYVVNGAGDELAVGNFNTTPITFDNGATCDRELTRTECTSTNTTTNATTKYTPDVTINARGYYKQSQEGLSVTVNRNVVPPSGTNITTTCVTR